MSKRLSIEDYLAKVSNMVDDEYGKMIRRQFADMKGSSELAMLESPSGDELEELKRAVAIMTPSEKENIEKLTDEQIQRIAEDAKVDAGNLAIFFNGLSFFGIFVGAGLVDIVGLGGPCFG